MKKDQFAALASGLVGADSANYVYTLSPAWKPKFTKEECDEIYNLPIKEKKKRVRELVAKHYAEDPEAKKPREWLRQTRNERQGVEHVTNKEEVLEL